MDGGRLPVVMTAPRAPVQAGGFLPASQRGRSYEQGIAHVIDWYRTFALLAGAELGLVRRPAKWFSPW